VSASLIKSRETLVVMRLHLRACCCASLVPLGTAVLANFVKIRETLVVTQIHLRASFVAMSGTAFLVLAVRDVCDALPTWGSSDHVSWASQPVVPDC